MGRAEDEMQRWEELYQEAGRILVATGAFRECSHGTYISTGDREAETRAYAQSRRRVDDGQVDGDHKEMAAVIKSLIEDTWGECSACHTPRRE